MASTLFYRTFLQRNSVFWATIIGVAFFGEMVIDKGVDMYWGKHNKGKLWCDIKEQYAQY